MLFSPAVRWRKIWLAYIFASETYTTWHLSSPFNLSGTQPVNLFSKLIIEGRELPVRLIQITDCHLGPQQSETLLGLNTDQSLEDVLQLIQKAEPRFDHLVCTGDVASAGHDVSSTADRSWCDQIATGDIGCCWNIIWICWIYRDWNFFRLITVRIIHTDI